MSVAMLRRAARWTAAVALLTALAGPVSATAAHADEKVDQAERDACLDAHERGQALRHEGKHGEAREQFLRCARDSCPAIVRADCGPWAEELAPAVASVIVQARYQGGQQAPIAKLTIDGDAMPTEGLELAVNPGMHRIRVELTDGQVVDFEAEVGAGDTRRVIEAVFRANNGQVAGAPTAPVSSERPDTSTRISSVAYAAVVVAGLSLGSGAYFGLAGKQKERSMLDGCAPMCSRSEVDAMRRDYLVANVAFGVAAGATAIAAWFFVHPTTTTTRPAAVAAAPLPDGALLVTTGVF